MSHHLIRSLLLPLAAALAVPAWSQTSATAPASSAAPARSSASVRTAAPAPQSTTLRSTVQPNTPAADPAAASRANANAEANAREAAADRARRAAAAQRSNAERAERQVQGSAADSRNDLPEFDDGTTDPALAGGGSAGPSRPAPTRLSDFDRNGDFNLSFDELSRLDDARARNFRNYDLNGDNRISAEEWDSREPGN